MDAPSINTRRLATLSAGSIAVLAAGLMVWQGSSAAFSETTSNANNTWDAASVALTDDDTGAATFQVAKVSPGDGGTKCIVVTSVSSVPGIVKSYVANPVASVAGLEDHMTLSVEPGTGGTFNACTGFAPDSPAQIDSLSAMAANSTDYSSGGTSWTTAGGTESKTYRISWFFDTVGMTQPEVDLLQGAHTGIDLVWELQNS